MKVHNTDLKSFSFKGGIISDFQDDIFHMTTTRKIRPECRLGQIPINSYVYFNDTYKLPVRIDMTIKIDSPEMYFIFGQGHIAFGSLWNNNRRIDDIAEPDHKPRTFINEIPINEFADISIIYNFREMQILINGEERLYSKKERYMKSELFSELNSKGFQIGLSCTKRIDLFIKQIKITENEDDFNIIHPQREEIPPITYNKEPAFDTYISELSDIFKNEIININNYLFSLKSLKFKRKVADSKITYLSPASGFAYVIFVSEKLFKQYIYRYNDKTDDRMTDVLRIINLQSPELANKLFGQLNECFGGGCVSTRTYNWNGITKKACGGRIEFKMDIIDFNNVKEFFKCAEELSQN